MKIIQKFIAPRSNTRPQWKMLAIRGIVIHHTANKGGTAKNHYDYFNRGANGVYASAHYFVDKNEIYHIIPNDEVAFHVNETKQTRLRWLDASIQFNNGNHYRGNGNVCTIGIEMCNEYDGSIHKDTIKKTQELTAMLLKQYGLGIDKVIRHYDQTYKNCPTYFVNNPTEWTKFKNTIQAKMTGTESTITTENEGELTMTQYKELLGKIISLNKEVDALKKEKMLSDTQKVTFKELMQYAYDSKIFEKNHTSKVDTMTVNRAMDLLLIFVSRYTMRTLTKTNKEDMLKLLKKANEEELFIKDHTDTIESMTVDRMLELVVSYVSRK